MTNFSRSIFAVVAVCAASSPGLANERILPVPTVTIRAGDVIDASQIKDRTYPVEARFRMTMVENPRALVGKIARRTLTVGEPVPVSAVEENRLVTRGVPATIVFEEGSLSITGVGVPQQNGAAGQMVQVKNMDSGRLIIGRVTDDGQIRVGAK